MLPNKEFESSELIIVHLVNLVLNELGPLFKLFLSWGHSSCAFDEVIYGRSRCILCFYES